MRKLWKVGGALVVLAGAVRLAPPLLRRSWRRLGQSELEKAEKRLDLGIPPLLLASQEKLATRMSESSAGERTEASPEVLEEYAGEMLPAFDPALYFRVAMPLAGRLSRLMYRVSSGGEDLDLRSLSGKSVVLVMSHRSNLDYVILAHVLGGRAVLSFAAGEWASGPVLGPLIRGLGSYFVRRDSGDPTYRRALERFVRTATEGRLTQAIFPEGGLSRDGKPRPAKIGLLDYMLRDSDPENGPDIVFVPVAAGYDRVLEDRFMLHLARKDAGRPSRGWLLRATASFTRDNIRLYGQGGREHFGRAVLEVGPPLSLSEYDAAHGLDLHALDREARIEEVSRFAEELMSRIAAVTPVLPVPLLAHVLLEAGEDLTRDELESRTRGLIEALQTRNARLPVAEAETVVNEALRMLLTRKLVVLENDIYAVASDQKELFQYYANALTPLLEA